MSKKPVITKILLDPNGPPFVVSTGTSFEGKFKKTQHGMQPLGIHAEIQQEVVFNDTPHEWILELQERPTVKLGGEENYVLFIRKKADTIEFKLFPESCEPITEDDLSIFDAEIPAAKILQIAIAAGNRTKPKMRELMNKAAGNLNDRNVRKFAENVADEVFKKRAQAIMAPLSKAITPNKTFLAIIANTIEALTLHENKGLIENEHKKVTTKFGGGTPPSKYTH